MNIIEAPVKRNIFSSIFVNVHGQNPMSPFMYKKTVNDFVHDEENWEKYNLKMGYHMTHQREKILKELKKTNMTWNGFLIGLKVLGVKKLKIKFEITTKSNSIKRYSGELKF